MDSIFNNAKALVEVMQRIPIAERQVSVEIAGKILEFQDQTRMCSEKESAWGGALTAAQGAVANTRGRN